MALGGRVRRHGARASRLGALDEAQGAPMVKRARETPKYAIKALDDAAEKLAAMSMAMLNSGGSGLAVYMNPIPVRPNSGKPYWKRTGRLMTEESKGPVKAGPTRRLLINQAPYGVVRHRMPESLTEQGKKWGRKGEPRYGAGATGAPDDRTAHFRADAVTAFIKQGGLAGKVQIAIRNLWTETGAVQT